jgi:hypothetical protein
MTTLADDDTTINLHDDLFWSDEHGWNQVGQSSERTITGSLVVQAALLLAGRPITLQPENDSSAWMTRAVVDQLRNFAAVPGKEMTLTLRGTPRTVIFRHHDGIALDARPVVHYSDVEAGDFYLVTLRFMEV